MKIIRASRELFWLWEFRIFCRIKKPYFGPFKFFIQLPGRVREKLHKKEYLTPKTIPNKIWIFWEQGWDEAPPLARLCRDSWIAYNPDWEVVQLSRYNVSNYIALDYSLEEKEITRTAYSNLVRLSLLSKYGGAWVDATTFTTTPLSHWLPYLMQSGFFGFNRKDTTIASWFLASEQDNILIKRWKEYADRYWRLVRRADRYFWVQYLFEYLLKQNSKARDVWRKTPKVSADGPYAIQRCLRQGDCNPDECADMVFRNNAPLHKLSLHIEIPDLFLNKIRSRLAENKR